MSSLTGFQRTYLRGLAHPLRPAVRVGKEGVTAPVLATIDEALDARELIKVSLPGTRLERRELAATIAERSAAECIGLLGGIAIFFRPCADPARRRILPPVRPTPAQAS